MAASNKPPVPEEASKSATMTKDENRLFASAPHSGREPLSPRVLSMYRNHAALATHIENEMQNTPLPGFLVHLVGVVLPWCEGTVGLLMILGLWTSVALIAGSLLMLMLQIGTCLAQNWDVAGAQLIYVLLYFILLTYCERNRGRLIGTGRRDDDKNEGCLIPTAPKVGRNDPCPCGFGKKYKKCCGAATVN